MILREQFNIDTNNSTKKTLFGSIFAGLSVLFLIIGISTYVTAAPSGAPTDLVATPGDGQVSLEWVAPLEDGGATITDYVVEYTLADANDWDEFGDGESGATTAVVSGLLNGTEYEFRVYAVNADGDSSEPSESVRSTPVSPVPSVPLNLVANPGNGQVSLEWDAPSHEGSSPIEDYIVEYSIAGDSDWQVFADAVSASTTALVTGLDNGTSYDFRVAAVNATKTSEPSSTATSTPRTVPGAPTGLSATPSNGQVALSWSAPANNGGSAVTDYVVQYSLAGEGDWQTFSDGTSTTTSATVTDLDNGVNYDFRVAAVNVAGTGAYSSTASSTPYTIPGAPTAVSAVRGNGQATVSFTAPANNGGSAITGYTVTSNPGNISASGSSSPITVTGLSNGTSYTFTVIATNAAGDSPDSAASNSVTPATTPTAPLSLAATPGNTQVQLSWSAPANNGGSAVTDYIVQYRLSANPTWTTFSDGVSTTTSATVTDLGNGVNYDFRVAAVNAAGTGAYSSTAEATPFTVPGAPTAVTAIRGDEEAVVSFTTPEFNGGSPITEYTVISNPGGTTATGSSSPITVTGLTNGTAYTFTVVATNAAGDSLPSAASNTVTPGAAATAPLSLVATPGSALVELSWTAPSSNGGSDITDYVVEYKLSTDSTWTVFSDGVSVATTATVSGLTNGSAYDFRVVAVNDFGSGAYSSVASATPRTTPDAPTGLSATPSNSQVALSWTAPANNGGSAITDYVIEYKLTADSTWEAFSDGTSTSTNATVNGLTNGSSYDFRVRAVNAAGNGSFSSNVTSTPYTTPGAPVIGTATRGNGQATVTFTAPASNGGSDITGYTVTSSPGGFTATGSNSPITVTGLSNGTSYTFTVVAANEAGNGAVSAASNSVTPATVPGAPSISSVVPGDREATITFAAPASNGGSAITGYTVTSNPGNFTGSSATVSPITVTGLENGVEYTFTIVASNDVGASPSSAVSDGVTPYTTPDAPTGITAVRGDEQAVVSFSAPDFDGGSAITGYTVTSSPGGISATGSGSPITVTGLENGTAYTFTVVATNAAGSSDPSGPSNSVTPVATPGAPTGLTVNPGNGEVELSWSAPANDGGSAIVDYVVEYKETSGSAWTTFSDGVSTSTSATVSGLANGTQYDFRVSAVNETVGAGATSSVVSTTPMTTPSAPTGLTVNPGNGEVELSWSAPENDGGSAIVDYVVEYKETSGSTWTTFSDGVSVSTTATVTGLTNGASYEFRTAAVNSVGNGSFSGVVSATPDLTYPAISDIVVVKSEEDSASVTITWKTDILSNTQVEYSTDTSFSSSTPLSNVGGVTEHSVVVAGLEACTTYNFRVASESLVDGGRTVSSGGSFKTVGCPEEPAEEDEDTQPGKGSSKDKTPTSPSPDAPVSDLDAPVGGGANEVDEEDTNPDLSTPEEGDEVADDKEETGTDATDEGDDEGSDWSVLVWVAAGVVGVGAVAGIAAASRRTEQ